MEMLRELTRRDPNDAVVSLTTRDTGNANSHKAMGGSTACLAHCAAAYETDDSSIVSAKVLVRERSAFTHTLALELIRCRLDGLDHVVNGGQRLCLAQLLLLDHAFMVAHDRLECRHFVCHCRWWGSQNRPPARFWISYTNSTVGVNISRPHASRLCGKRGQCHGRHTLPTRCPCSCL